MNLTISGHHLDITDSLRHFITSKMDRLERHSSDVQNIHVILNVEKLRQKAEATVSLKGVRIFADTSDADMYAAIDMLTDKLDRQLIKHKEKVKGHGRGKLSDMEDVENIQSESLLEAT
jgi:putative sigma-54 modulation protein